MQTISVTSYIPVKPKYDCWQWALVAKSPWHRQNMGTPPLRRVQSGVRTWGSAGFLIHIIIARHKSFNLSFCVARRFQ